MSNNIAERTEVVKQEEIAVLHTQMEKLVHDHGPAIKEAGALESARKVMEWAEKCEDGSVQAENRLYMHGLEVLDNIKQRLTLALEEQQRIMEESPSVAGTGSNGDTEKFRKATKPVAVAADSLARLKDAEDKTSE